MFKETKKLNKLIVAIIALTAALFFVRSVSAAYQLVSPGGTITIGEFVYDDAFVATTSDCTISISNPSHSLIVNEAVMSTTTDGWHYYNFSSTNAEGAWPTVMTCGSVPTGDLAKLDKTFFVGYANASTTDIANEVWNAATSTMTAPGTIGNHIVENLDVPVSTAGGGSLTAADIWSYSSRSLTTFGSLTTDVATAVWANGTRSLTTFGTLVADVWNNGTRTLTSRILGGGGNLATESYIDSATTTLTNTIETASTSLATVIDANTTDAITTASTSLAAVINANTNNAILTASTSLNQTLPASIWSYAGRSLTTFGSLTTDVATAVWANGTRSLTTFGTLVADVWNNGTRRLTDSTLSGGGNLATESFVDTAIDTATSTLVDTIATASSSITTIVNNNTNNAILTASTSLSQTIPASVWNYSGRSLTTFGSLTTDVATAVWANGTRSLTTFGTLVADVWNNGTRRLTDSTLSGGGNLATESFVDTAIDTATSTIVTEVLENRSLISALNNISAADVWAYGTRSINNGTVTIDATSVDAIWDIATSTLSATGSVGKQLVDNLDARVSTVGGSSLTAADIWSYATRTLTETATSSIATAVWANASRDLTNYGNDITAADVWNVLTSSLTTVGSIGNLASTSLASLDVDLSTRASLSSQQAGWTASMSNTDRVLMGRTYRAKVYLRNFESVPTNAFSAPTVTLYDADRNVVASGIAMTNLAAGIYEYTYSVPGNASEGLWEAVISSEVESGKVLQTNDYWTVEGSPAQVIINSMTDLSVPTIGANVTITNEGISGYEYQYEWCVVSSVNNACGGGDDVYYASAAKYINSGEDWNTNLSATVSSVGSYFFKLVVYYGAESSGSSRSFTATSDVPEPPAPPGGGGGGGGGGQVPIVPTPTSTPDGEVYQTADFNRDHRVSSVDFSILLAFWRTEWPFRNPYIDINNDRQVNSVEFSIMMFQWGSR